MKDSSSSHSSGAGSNPAGLPCSTATASTSSNATPSTPSTPVTATAAVAPSDPSTAPPAQQQPRGKSNIHEMRNQDYVSRLMAATPPYLYSAPVGPNNFFFSDMLRSLVQARNNETARVLQLQQQQQQQAQQQQQQQAQQQAALVRRPRKRSWSHRPYYEQLRERRDAEEKQHHHQQQQLQQNMAPEKPLELTNKAIAPYGYPKMETKPTTTAPPAPPAPTSAPAPPTSTAANGGKNASLGGAVDSVLQDNTPPAASLPPQDLVLPPPPPVWYPPLYAPYGIDPLHFFIDLRVSGHIYDRKKENVSPLSSSNGGASIAEESAPSAGPCSGAGTGQFASSLLSKQRHGSAFTVPIPKAAQSDAINLCANAQAGAGGVAGSLGSKFEHYAKYYDLGEAKENHPGAGGSSTAANLSAAAAAAAAAANLSKSGASYMLQHLPRLYSQFAAHQAQAQSGQDADAKSESASVSASLSAPDLCDEDSMGGRGSSDTGAGLEGNSSLEGGTGGGQGNCDIDVEIIDSIKYRTDGESSRCSSNDEASITQID
ncbi:uncharacterized protein [Drosophila bipectinata]|uniref:uncharacterized protein n=1 Tax=Drosophila bipectinata TaxID=42026 RepID=UPI001C8A1F79|nr:protein enabled [Drosophila bipectinata]